MVKKTDSYARVLRPGESMMLGRRSSEFEVVLFRPKQHVRVEDAHSSDQLAETDAAGLDRDSFSKESANSPNGGAAAVTGNKVKFALGAGANEALHSDRKRTGTSAASPNAATGLMRDVALEPPFDEGTGPSPGKRGSNAGGEVRFADSAADAPLFFDTTVCIFYDELTKMDYVATGRSTADSKGIHYIPHAVVLGDEMGTGAYCNYNITRPDGESLANKDDDAFEEDEDDVLVSRSAANNGPITMGAADGVSVNLRRLGTCAGFLVCATLFSKVACLNRERNVFYMIRKPRNPLPLCLVPLCVSGEASKSCISLMIRKIKVHGDSTWEVVNVNEALTFQDVTSLILQLQNRGLKDPAHFTRDFELKSSANHAGDGTYGGGEESFARSSSDSSSTELEASHSQKHLSEGQEPERSLTSEGAIVASDHQSPAAHARSGRSFSELLVDVPRVTREGRRQYNVGRSHVQRNLFDGDTSEEDEVLDDAMRAVVPYYANTSLIRYENGAYNVGSKAEKLVTHYVDHRETYGLDAADHRLTGGGSGVGKEVLPPLLTGSRGRSSADWGTPIPVLDRCQVDDENSVVARPELPPDLLITSQDRRLAAALQQQQRGSVSSGIKKRQSTIARARRSSSVRPSAARKGTSRPSSSAGGGQRGTQQRKKKGGKVTRAKLAAAADSATRTDESRDADGVPSIQPATRGPHSTPSSNQKGGQARVRTVGTKQKRADKR
ncbi:hypothetical protein N2W54_006112 [Lotmaria passim]